MRAINKELKELHEILSSMSAEKEHIFQEKFLSIQNRYTEPEDQKAIEDFVLNGYQEIGEELKELETHLSVQEQLAKDKEIIPIAYIARTYFGKSTAWLQQRIYGYKVRGKVYKLNDKDLKTFNDALQDISKRIGSLVITQ